MDALSLSDLLAACSPGGSSMLTSVTHLEPAGGQHVSIAPAKFSSAKENGSVFAFEKRYREGQAEDAVIIDSKQSQLNRIESALVDAIADGVDAVADTPRIRVRYGNSEYFDMTLPHRAFDAHIRAGSTESGPVTADPAYRAARDSTPGRARALLEMSPVSLVFGSWDATRKSNQVRQRSCLTGEIIGFLADQSGETVQNPPKRGGARVDPVGMQIEQLDAGARSVLDPMRTDLSPKLISKVEGEIKKATTKPMSMSSLGFGGIPPTLSQLGGVAVKDVVRTHVLSFAALRQLRFGAGVEGDAACRAVLAALALNGLARSDSELNLRANCDLTEAGPAEVVLDQRYGQKKQLRALTIDEADELLLAAVAHAKKVADLTWSGVALDVEGNSAIVAGISDEAGDE